MYLKKIFNNKRIIVTGHTGFKGSWLTAWLKLLGANIMGISLNLPTRPSHFFVSKISSGIKDIRLDIAKGGFKAVLTLLGISLFIG